jgi:hypothetical protein
MDGARRIEKPSHPIGKSIDIVMCAHSSHGKTLSKRHVIHLFLRPVDAVQYLIDLFVRPHEEKRSGSSYERVHGPPNTVFRRKKTLAELLQAASIDYLAPKGD